MSTISLPPIDPAGVEVSFSRYRVKPLDGRDRDGAKLVDPDSGRVVAVIEAITDGWAVQIHGDGSKLGTAGPDEEFGDAVARAEAALAPPLPAAVERYVHVVYGATGDRADWARRTARALLAGGKPTEAMPRARFRGASDSRTDALRRVVASAQVAQ